MDEALDLAWSRYRGWARRARAIRAELDSWRLRALALTVAGAVLSTLAAQWPGWVPSLAGGARVLSALSGVSMALAAWTARFMLNAATEQTWIRARALAERAKSESFLYASGVQPYDGADAARKLLDKITALIDQAKDIAPVAVSGDDREDQPPLPLSFANYSTMRYRDQLKFYADKSARHERSASICTRVIQGLSALAAVLGGVGTVQAATGAEIWIATLSAATSAVGAYALAQRYQRLAATYRLMIDRLEVRYVSWSVASKGGVTGADQSFIRDVETMLSAENDAWVADFKSKEGATSAQGASPGPGAAPVAQ